MSTSAGHHAAHLSSDVARHGMTVVTAVQLGLHNRRRHLEAHRRAGVNAVSDLAGRLSQARASEDEAWGAASSLSHENASLRQALAAAQARIASLEAVIVATADRLAR